MKLSDPNRLEKIKAALGFDEMNEDEQNQLMIDLGNIIFTRTMIRLMEQMDEQTKKSMSELIKKDVSQDDMIIFLENAVPGANEIVIDTVDELTSDILAVTS
jgi:hypothetical protein